MRFTMVPFIIWAILLVSDSILAQSGNLTRRAERPKPIGIQLDQEPTVDHMANEGTHYDSYSAIIEYRADVVKPWCGLYAAELYNLAWAAHGEMRAISRQRSRTPKSMGVLAHGQRIYFASSVISDWPDARVARVAHSFDDDNVAEYMLQCLSGEGGDPAHKTGGRCVEPNVIRLFHQSGGTGKPTHNKFLVAWADLNTGQENVYHNGRLLPYISPAHKTLPPCEDAPREHRAGCETTFKVHYQLEPVTPILMDNDPTNQFEFTHVNNPRPAQEV